ncbi:MAG TPA: hypothetical protein DCK76_06515 [Desulfotomaculum sp.]|nr:MAG: hypothetical protein XD84_1794 [Desulfotomaculum sp. 46_80]HAG11028.1 hypothetical protein [Desulfotomaculum sp.]HBY04903.1 hypothetical protein [Desulfotomaculum sp.]
MEDEKDAACCWQDGGVNPFHETPTLIKSAHESKHKRGIEYYLDKIKEWEYCYCANCRQMRFSTELEATEDGIRCAKCKSYNLEEPGWVVCPYHKDSLVKCARAGKGIVKLKHEAECKDHCHFRVARGT